MRTSTTLSTQTSLFGIIPHTTLGGEPMDNPQIRMISIMKTLMSKTRLFAVALLIANLILVSNASGQAVSIWTNLITGTNPNNSNPYTTGDVKNANITVSGIGRGTGITGQNANDRYNASGWTTGGSISTNDYYNWTLTPATGYHVKFSSFVYTGQISSSTANWSFRSNANSDNFSSNIPTAATSGATISLAATAYQNITASTEFRLYGYSFGNSSTTYSVNDFTFNGSVLGTSVTDLTNFSTCINTASTAQSFTINGAGLSSTTATITIAGSTNYEVSVTSATTGFAGSVTFNASGAAVSAKQVWVRLKSNGTAGNYNGENINISGGGFSVANNINVACSGVVVNGLNVTASSSPTTICSGSNVTLTTSATPVTASVPSTLLSENFNAATNSWTTTNNSTGGTPANSAWTLRSNGYQYTINFTTYTFHSNDNSQFYLSNSDAQGNGGTTSTILQSPAINTLGYSALTLDYYHYFRLYAAGETGKVEVSTDNTNWTTLVTYSATTGAVAAFAHETGVNLNSYVGYSTLYIRFNFYSPYGYYWAIDNVTLSGTPMTYTYNYSWTGSPAGTAGLPAGAGTPSTSNASIVANPTLATSYTATATNATTGCSASSSAVPVTINPAPTITFGTISSICAGATSFTIPYISTSGTPDQYSISGTGITTVTNGTLGVTPITVNLSSPASGSPISFVLTVRNSTAGCVSGNVNGSVTVNALPTFSYTSTNITCNGLTDGTITITASGGTGPYTYSLLSGDNFSYIGPSPKTITNLSPITYTLRVRDNNGCIQINKQ